MIDSEGKRMEMVHGTGDIQSAVNAAVAASAPQRDSLLTIVVECKSKRQSHRVTGVHIVHSIFIQLASCVLMVCI